MELAQLHAAKDTVAVQADSQAAGNGKADWLQQKEEQARLRKKESELKKTEAEIEKLEMRNASIDSELSDPANGTNSVLLQELSKEHEANSLKLEKLMEQWEALSE